MDEIDTEINEELKLMISKYVKEHPEKSIYNLIHVFPEVDPVKLRELVSKEVPFLKKKFLKIRKHSEKFLKNLFGYLLLPIIGILVGLYLGFIFSDIIITILTLIGSLETYDVLRDQIQFISACIGMGVCPATAFIFYFYINRRENRVNIHKLRTKYNFFRNGYILLAILAYFYPLWFFFLPMSIGVYLVGTGMYIRYYDPYSKKWVFGKKYMADKKAEDDFRKFKNKHD